MSDERSAQSDALQEESYLARVKTRLGTAIEESIGYAKGHLESIQLIAADAWEELRQKATALSTQDLEQLSGEVERFMARKSISDTTVSRYTRMLQSPYFARVDFREDGTEETDRIYIGLYSVKDEEGTILVTDWRAPVSGLYYDCEPGRCTYTAPGGEVTGSMYLKRQYRMENGKIVYFVDTDVSIDDRMLLDMLSGNTGTHMKQIVSTIQKEQNAAIRHGNARVLCVVGAAGSGKTSVAMHRIAYLMYRSRDTLSANRVCILSPSPVFSEYVSQVLPELGEEAAKMAMLYEIAGNILGRKIEHPLRQTAQLLDSAYPLRMQSMKLKNSAEFAEYMEQYVENFRKNGPKFEEVRLETSVLIEKDTLQDMYHREVSSLTPAQRLERISLTLSSRLDSWDQSLYTQYEKQFIGKYRGRQLSFMTKMAVAQRLQNVRAAVRRMCELNPEKVYRDAIKGAPQEIRDAFEENVESGICWYEDAIWMAYIAIALGLAPTDKTIYHLIIDEAQDYSEAALKLMNLYYPRAHVTVLGDPRQRTTPGLPACDVSSWGRAFGMPDAEVLQLERCYRCTQEITEFLNRFMPESAKIEPFGRRGEEVEMRDFTVEGVQDFVRRAREAGAGTVAVITRTPHMAAQLAEKIDKGYLVDETEDETVYEPGDTLVACFHMCKGMEFDAAAVVWEDADITSGEARRLYTACSRALHNLTFFAPQSMRDKIQK